jgi:hypothetical protein
VAEERSLTVAGDLACLYSLVSRNGSGEAGPFHGCTMTPEFQSSFERKSGAALMIAAYASFFAWLTHSFAVRAFVDSFHLLSKLVRR